MNKKNKDYSVTNQSSSVTSIGNSVFEYLARTFPVACASDEFIYFPQVQLPEPKWSTWDHFSSDSVKETIQRLSSWESELDLLSSKELDLALQIDAALIKKTVRSLREQLSEVRSWEFQPTFYLTIACTGLAESIGSEDPAAKQWLDSMVNIGANPHNQVISGVGLSMSLKSIMTLPPFANAGSPIIWIDDHLKRLLHEALGHLDPLKKANPPMDVSSYRCCKDASFEQDRYPDGVQQGDINWAVNEYLPRLVRGCVMDILIWDRSSPGAGVYVNYVVQVLNGAPVPNKVALGKSLRTGVEGNTR